MRLRRKEKAAQEKERQTIPSKVRKVSQAVIRTLQELSRPCREGYRLELDARFVQLPELVYAAKPLLREWKGAKIAALPLASILKFLVYPLPEKEVKQLTQALSQPKTSVIAISLSTPLASRHGDKEIQAVLFAPESFCCNLYFP